MKRIYYSAAILPVAALLASCGGNNATTDNSAMMSNDSMMADNMSAGMMGNNGMMANDAMGTTALTPQQFVDKAAQSDSFEIQSAKIAKDKATSKQVKDFAAKMITDHTKSTADLKSAASKVEGVTPDATLPSQLQDQLDQLNAASGDAFDNLYITQQKDAHQKALDLLRDYADNGSAEPLKQFAANTAKVVKTHIEMLDKM